MTSSGTGAGNPAWAWRPWPYRPTNPRKIAGGQLTWLRVACALISSAWSGSK